MFTVRRKLVGNAWVNFLQESILQETSEFHSTTCKDEILIYPAQEMHNETLTFMHIGSVRTDNILFTFPTRFL